MSLFNGGIMKMNIRLSALSVVLLAFQFSGTPAMADIGITLNAAEIGVAKFHRKDNQVHVYGDDNAWKPFIAPVQDSLPTPMVIQNAGELNYTILFSTLDELLDSMTKLSASTSHKIKVLNINGHGIPGAMWFPPNADALAGDFCADWRNSANSPDQSNYDQYYSPVGKDEIMQIRQISDNPNVKYPCVSGLDEWKQESQKFAGIQGFFTADAQIHLASCVVGLGSVGEAFTQGLAQVLLTGATARVETSMAFGLGDWSMPEGMGFWDYQTDAQLDHDNQIYPVDHKDREIMQKGTVRAATLSNGAFVTGIIADQDFMFLDGRASGKLVFDSGQDRPFDFFVLPADQLSDTIRIPGTQVRLKALRVR